MTTQSAPEIGIRIMRLQEEDTRTPTANHASALVRCRPGRMSPGALVVIGVAVLAGWPQGPVSGQQPNEDIGRISLGASLDLSSRYLFRGHEKDERGAVLQPEVTLSYALFQASSGVVRELSAGAVLWSSVHAATRAYPGDFGVFEVDLGLSLDAALSNGWSAGLIYTSYLAPTDAFDEVREVAVELGFGSVGEEGALSFAPRALLAQEVDDVGGPEDTYVEVGGTFGLPSTGSIRWGVPVVIGMSIDGFYRDAMGANEWFGLLGTGVQGSVDLVHLGVGRLPGQLAAAVDLAFLNRDAELTRNPANDLLWTVRIGLALEL